LEEEECMEDHGVAYRIRDGGFADRRAARLLVYVGYAAAERAIEAAGFGGGVPNRGRYRRPIETPMGSIPITRFNLRLLQAMSARVRRAAHETLEALRAQGLT
jgi:hypothetical protein